ncbi:hypothetical protein [Paenibacillus caseinilyticus]|uniref:hypothetical protein n=1 Tax=Paenibacillus caseinilyticus TaxID=3098138 RepID=UPI0022B92AA7|nr:hypothetical protein [Paenibacillus caseinilyticus]MCZ8522609.1 hypothetical protein [Paenibacillus caseinilyticus]
MRSSERFAKCSLYLLTKGAIPPPSGIGRLASSVPIALNTAAQIMRLRLQKMKKSGAAAGEPPGPRPLTLSPQTLYIFFTEADEANKDKEEGGQSALS